MQAQYLYKKVKFVLRNMKKIHSVSLMQNVSRWELHHKQDSQQKPDMQDTKEVTC